MPATITPIRETHERLYLPTMDGSVIQIGLHRAIILPLATARTHLEFVERMASDIEGDTLAAAFPEYWTQARDDLRWAVGETETYAERQRARINQATPQGAI